MAILGIDVRVYINTKYIVSIKDFPDKEFFRVYTLKDSEYYEIPYEVWEFKAFIREWRNNE